MKKIFLMKQGSTIFLKGIILLITVGLLAGMVLFPPSEGRAADLDIISIYTDPFIIYGYIASIPLFMALYKAFKLLGYIEKNDVFSKAAVMALKTIKYCALAFIVFVVGGEAFIFFGVSGDDKTGPFVLGMFATFVSVVVAIAVTIFEKLLQNAIEIKSENDLTV